MLKLTALTLCLLAAPLFAAPPPPATEVRANVHAASTLALGLLDRTPTAGDAAQESQIFQTVAAGGLGEVMGWGQNYWDNVDPAVTKKVLAAFQSAFRLLEGLGDSTLSFAALTSARTKLAPTSPPCAPRSRPPTCPSASSKRPRSPSSRASTSPSCRAAP